MVTTATEKIVTLNDDFTDALSDVPDLLARAAPFAILIQEGKRSRFRRMLRRLKRRARRTPARRDDWPPGYRAIQQTKTEAQAGLAIVWDAAVAPLLSGPHFQVLVEPQGAAMLPRGVLWVVVGHPVWGPTILATTHRPPSRYRSLWPEYDRALRRWADRLVARRVILGLDTNTRELATLARRVGMTVAGKGIDAVMGIGLELRNPRRLKRRHSDHRPVAVDATR